ncbi:MAG: A/G-specific adenine glycosylase [Parachlamydiaceae bacterium]
MPKSDLKKLKEWFLKEKRLLPWRETTDPYKIWISEVMLQQTQADVVIPFYHRWLARYPTLRSLAESTPQEVIKMWEGLGYYSRARNLYEGAKLILNKHRGIFPDTYEALNEIKGLGPYTINAILSFAFHRKTFPLDGNGIRVLSRYFAYQEDVSKQNSLNWLRKKGEELLPEQEPWIVSEAIIELGATKCKKTKPHCTSCPLQGYCQAFRSGTAENFPIKNKKVSVTHLERFVAICLYNQKLLVRKGEKGKLMADLYEFPYFDLEKIEPALLRAKIETLYHLKINLQTNLPKERHAFTRFQAELYPTLFHVTPTQNLADYEWLSAEQLTKVAFSSGHRRILDKVRHLL